VDWSLRVCSRRGHETYCPDEPELRGRLNAHTPAGEAWRCLRCGDFVIGPPKNSGPAKAAPEVPTGASLRDRTIMRLLAAERIVRAALLILLALVIVRFRDSHAELQAAFDNELVLLRPLANQLGWNLDGSDLLHGVNRVFAFTSATLTWIVAGLVGYSCLLLVESYGLWTVRRWGEYFSVVLTGIFLPWEIYELVDKATALKTVLLLINIAAVAWLVWSKRLFGVRGGGAAYLAEHSAESLLTVQRSADVGSPSG